MWPDSSGIRHLHRYLLCAGNTEWDWENKLASIKAYFTRTYLFLQKEEAPWLCSTLRGTSHKGAMGAFGWLPAALTAFVPLR